MQGKTHFLFALFLSTFFTQPIEWIILIIASLLPDIDSSKSLLGRHVPILGKVFRHRGFFHSLFFFIPATIIIYTFSPKSSLVFLIGILSHLLLDATTKAGLRIYPFKKKIKGPLRTGGIIEKVLFIFLIILIIWRIGF